MAGRIAWWTIPFGCIVMLRVLTLGDAARPTVVPGADPALEAASASRADGATTAAPELPTIVRVRDASTGITRPLPLAAMAERALLVCLPAELVGCEIAITAWCRSATGRDVEPALKARLRVRADGTVPLLGLPAGRYDVEVVPAGGTPLCANGVAAPGRATFPVAPAAAGSPPAPAR